MLLADKVAEVRGRMRSANGAAVGDAEFMLLTSAISGNKLVEFLSCIVSGASLSQVEITGIPAIRD